jgi:opacity protein-like surface antigen
MAPGDADVDSSLTSVHGSVLYFFDTGYTLAPYAAGGIGVAKFSHQVTRPPASTDRTEIGFNVGAGVTLPLNDRAWARGDFRFFKHIDDVPSVWRLGAAITLRVGS